MMPEVYVWATITVRHEIRNSYISNNGCGCHVEASKDEEGNADLHLVSSSCRLQVRLQHGLNHAVAACTEKVVDKREGDQRVLKAINVTV